MHGNKKIRYAWLKQWISEARKFGLRDDEIVDAMLQNFEVY